VLGCLEWGFDDNSNPCTGHWQGSMCLARKHYLWGDTYSYWEDQSIGGSCQTQDIVSYCFWLCIITDGYQGIILIAKVCGVVAVIVMPGWHEQTLAFAEVECIDGAEQGNMAIPDQ